MMGSSAFETRAGQPPKQETATAETIIPRLAGLGIETGRFTGQSVETIRAGVRAIIDALKEVLNGEQRGTVTAGERIADPAAVAAEDTAGRTIEEMLEGLTGGKFLSIEAMNNALQGLAGIHVEIPSDERTRLRGLFPGELSPKALAEIGNIKDRTEGGNGPLVMQLPARVIVDGEELPFSLATMAEILAKAKIADPLLKGLWLGECVADAVKQQTWSSQLKVWSSACLKDSRNRRYENQLQYQAEMLGAGHGIEPDMLLAIILHYLASAENLAGSGFMNLNAQSSTGYQLFVGSDRDSFNLYGSGISRTIATAGIGASCEIRAD